MFDKIFKKRFLIFSLILLVATIIAPVFAFNSNLNTTQTIMPTTAEDVVEEEEYITEEFLTLNYQPQKTNPQISLAGWSATNNTLYGGSTITITNKSGVIWFNSPHGGTTSWQKTYTSNNGFELKGFNIYNGTSASDPLKYTITFGTSISVVGSNEAITAGKISGAQFICTTEDIVSDYTHTDNIYIEAIVSVITYNLNLYYQADQNVASYYYKTVSYTIKQGVTLTKDGNTVDDDISDFGYWMIRKAAITSDSYNGYTVSVNTSTKTITVSQSSPYAVTVNVRFKYSSDNSAGYILESLESNGSGYSYSYGTIGQNESNPLVAAKINRTYTLKIENRDTSNIWYTTDFDNDGTACITHGDQDDAQVLKDNRLTGAYASKELETGTSDSFSSVNIHIKDEVGYAYPFMGSVSAQKGVAFYKGNSFGTSNTDFTNSSWSAVGADASKYYYVFNYGYDLVGWRIGYSLDNNTWYYATVSGSNFTFPATSSYPSTAVINAANIDIDNLAGFTSQKIAELLDIAYAGTTQSSEGIILLMKPVWQAVKINVQTEDVNKVEITYNQSGYNISGLNSGTGVPIEGKSITNYVTTNTTNGAKIIVVDGTYNYINIPHSYYTYNSSDKDYSLEVAPEYADNIYKVYLDGVKGYTLDETDSDGYVNFNTFKSGYTGSGSISDYAANKYTFFSTVGLQYKANIANVNVNSYEYVSYSEWAAYHANTSNGYTSSVKWIEDYIYSDSGRVSVSTSMTGKFAMLKQTYTNCLVCGDRINDFVFLQKVFDVSTDPYIYLVNEHEYKMPVFTRDYYDLIFYQNNCSLGNKNNCPISGSSDTDPMVHKYKTKVYEDATGAELEAYKIAAENYNFEDANLKKWYYAHNPKQDSVSHIEAFWFRKYYNLDVNTLLNGETDESFHGYVGVNIEDKIPGGTESKKYVVLFYTDGMKIYEYNSANAIKDMAADGLGSFLIKPDSSPEEYIRLYAGCDLELVIFDQSQDTETALEDDRFVDMVGYRYASLINASINGVGESLFSRALTDKDDNNAKYDCGCETCETETNANNYCKNNPYSYVRKHHTIENQDYDSCIVIKIDVYFEEIIYDFTVELNYYNAGNFVVGCNATRSEQYTRHTIEDVSIKHPTNDQYTIIYNANAGYEFKSNAFTLTDGTTPVTLMDAASLRNAEDTFEQEYLFNFSSMWLRDIYYANFDTDFSVGGVNNTDLGTIFINTQVIEFAVGYKLYDPNQTKLDGEKEGIFVSELTGETFKLTASSAEGYLNALNSYVTFTKIEDKSGFLIIENGNWALLNSRMYCINSYTSQNENYFTSYNFLLSSAPTTEFKLTPIIIKNMVGGSVNQIIPDNEENRTLYIMFEVRKAVEVTIVVDDTNSKDPDTNRTTVVSNGNGNTTAVDKYGLGTETIYSYQGLENTISSTFISTDYSRVEYYLDSVLLDDPKFMVDPTKANELKIKYIVNSLEAKVSYTVDGANKTEAQVLADNLLSDISLVAYTDSSKATAANPRELYLNEIVRYSYKIVTQDYSVSIKINGITTVISEDSDDIYFIEREILSTDYGKGSYITIEVVIDSLPRDVVQVKFALKDSTKAVTGEPAYGTVDVYINGSKATPNGGSEPGVVEVTIIQGRRNIQFEIILNEGYTYYGIKHNNNSIDTTKSLTGNKLHIANIYSLADAGVYVIYVDKTNVTATLQIDGDYKVYSMNSDGVVPNVAGDRSRYVLNGLYVNKKIVFTAMEHDREVLDYFYYTAGGTTKYLTSDGTSTGNPLLELTLTSDILETLTKTAGVYQITFGVVGTPKYRINYSIIGEENIKVDGFKAYVNGNTALTYNSGDFYVTGTNVTFKIDALVEGKYYVEDWINGSMQTKADSLNKTYALTQDIDIQFKIYPKNFAVRIEEKIYNNLTDLNNGTPTDVPTEDWVGSEIWSGQYYGDTASIAANTDSESCKLYSIEIAKNGVDDKFVIELIDGTVKTYKVALDGTKTEQSPMDAGYEITLNNITKRITINYTTEDTMIILFNYVDYKAISQQG